jgi:hypothetical protein
MAGEMKCLAESLEPTQVVIKNKKMANNRWMQKEQLRELAAIQKEDHQ